MNFDIADVFTDAQRLLREVELHSLLAKTLDMAIARTQAHRGLILLRSLSHWQIVAEVWPERRLVRTNLALSLDEAAAQNPPLLPVAIVSDAIATAAEIREITDFSNSSFAIPQNRLESNPHALVTVSLSDRDCRVGLLYLETRLPLTSEDKQYLLTLAPWIAIALINAQFRAKLKVKNQKQKQKLSQAIESLKVTEKELIQAEQMATLGQLVAGIAHEINTPMGAIQASIGNIALALENSLKQLPLLFKSLSVERQHDFFDLLEAARKYQSHLSFREERKIKRALKEKLRDRGIQDVETVAETWIKLGIWDDIERFLPLLQDSNYKLILDTAYNLAIQKQNSENIKLAVERASKIVFALKTYARQDDSGQKIREQVTEEIEVVLTIYQNLLKQGIAIHKNYQDVPPILCYPAELNQVWTNLIHNAIQAMNNQGQLTISVEAEEDWILVKIADSGMGIPPEAQERIFEAFFTTKSAGEGSGLGLNIVRKIIEKHEGKIAVSSQPGCTTFSVWLPIT
jgi:signal transduction histidine kinase